eukprot:4601641-Pyramimonas_sp.AAC.1
MGGCPVHRMVDIRRELGYAGGVGSKGGRAEVQKLLTVLHSAGMPLRPRDWEAGQDESTDDEALGPARPEDVCSVYDVHVRTTAPSRHLRAYKDGVMALLTQPLLHKHSPYCGLWSLGRCRFGFPQPKQKRTVKKDQSKLWNNGSKNRYFVRRRDNATMMGMYNPQILRRWRASMDLQVVESSFAVARYILGYVLKNDTAKDAAAKLQQEVAKLPRGAPVASQGVYRLAYMSTQGRVTSTFEACHMLLGVPVVRISRDFQWIHTGMPETYSAFVPVHLWQTAIKNPEAQQLPEPAPPAVIARYAEWRARKVEEFLAVDEAERTGH